MPRPGDVGPVFREPTGRRWQRIRLGAILLGATSTLVVIILIGAALLPVKLPGTDAFASPASRGFLRTSPGSAQRRAIVRNRLQRSFMPRSRPGTPRPGRPPLALPPGGAADSGILAAFYVNWDDNSFAALRAHAERLDWVIAEWGFIASSGDTLRMAIQPKVLDTLRAIPAAHRPKVLLMVTNVLEGGGGFGGARGTRLLADQAHRRHAAHQIAREVRRFGLAGVTVDFEEVAEGAAQDHLVFFLDDLRQALGPGLLLTQAIGLEFSTERVKQFSDRCDKIILMLYNEHDGKQTPGPVASRSWYEEKAKHLLDGLPPGKAIAAIGAFGYDWNDAGAKDTAYAVTAQEVWRAASRNRVVPGYDTVSHNPFLAFTDPDSVDHFIWYLDAVTGMDEIRIARGLGITGAALWRLGGEDPSLWRGVGRHAELLSIDSLEALDPEYDVQFDGQGELLSIKHEPRAGHRRIAVDATGVVSGVQTDSVPAPWIVSRTGNREHEVAITFDDGPDPRYTGMILDTLKSRGATATFFVIGQAVEAHPGLVRRMLREGHEVGNHTLTHPDLAIASRWSTQFEINSSARLLEAVLDRRTILFRPPFLGDADPTTPDELVPIDIGTQLSYLTVGTRVDAQDWRRDPNGKPLGPDVIMQNVLLRRAAGSVVLLHDGGGDRKATVAVLGRLIDSLRARGDTIVSVGALAGLSLDQVMPNVTGRDALTRLLELGVFGAVRVIGWSIYVLFYTAIILGICRLVIVLGLAAVQRYRRRPAPTDYAPSVSVVIPAYREEAVISQTVASVVAQEYRGTLQIIVVDDGSPDNTSGVLQEAYGDHPGVLLLRKSNGGKASALNFGIAHATGEIIVGMDADTMFEPDTIHHLVAPLADPLVGAVAGNAKVGNRINLVTRWQALEYVTSQNLDRRAFALLDCITVIPGAIGAFRKTHVAEAGGFSHDTLAEDQDLTLAIGRRGHQVAYADRAIAWTEAPDTLRTLARQRFRWAFGTLQCAWKHRDLLFRRKAGTLGFVALPNVWLFQLFYSSIAPIADLVFIASLVAIYAFPRNHGAEYTVSALTQIVGWYAIFLLVDWLASMLAFLMEPGEDRRLTWLVFLQRFAYRQVMYWVVMKSVVAALRGGLVGWGAQERKATVDLRAV